MLLQTLLSLITHPLNNYLDVISPKATHFPADDERLALLHATIPYPLRPLTSQSLNLPEFVLVSIYLHRSLSVSSRLRDFCLETEAGFVI